MMESLIYKRGLVGFRHFVVPDISRATDVEKKGFSSPRNMGVLFSLLRKRIYSSQNRRADAFAEG
jgi:hypothetical protein